MTNTFDALKVSLRVAAKVMQDNVHAVAVIQDSSEDWPQGTVEQAQHTLDLCEAMFGALVRLYLRTL